GPICFAGALGRTLNVQEVRLACGLPAPPRSWTLLVARVPRRWLRLGRREGPICFVGALGRTLNVERLRLACGLPAPPRSWTLLVARPRWRWLRPLFGPSVKSMGGVDLGAGCSTTCSGTGTQVSGRSEG